MLLSTLGVAITRRQAMALFGIAKSPARYTGTALDQITGVLRSTKLVSGVRWRFLKRFSFDSVAHRLRRQLDSTGTPTLIWFGAVCLHRPVRAFHIALAVGVRPGRILLLDPLGRRPSTRRFNVAIRDSSTDSSLLGAHGSFYQIDPAMGAGVLEWRRPRFILPGG